jgi:hypothetical protein
VYVKNSQISNDGKLLSNLGGEVITFCFLTHGEKFEFGYHKKDHTFIKIISQMLEIDQTKCEQDLICFVSEDEVAVLLQTDQCNEQKFALISFPDESNCKCEMFQIKEWNEVHFKYPAIILVKGGLEIISIDLCNMKIYYYRLNAPFVVFTSKTSKETETLP